LIAVVLLSSFSFHGTYGLTEVAGYLEKWLIKAQNFINSNNTIYEKNNGSIMKDSTVESNPEELRYKKGQTFSISLKSFATMGYRWNITDNYNTTVIRYIDHAFQSADPKVIGGPISEIFNFEALNMGSTILKFSNIRGLHEKPEEERVFFIKIID
jgi:predicted secreted protein